MKTYRITPGAGLESLTVHDEPSRALSAREVRVRVHAVSLNHRDLLIARRPATDPRPTVPVSDGAGEILEIGPDVRRLRVGDRVVGSFFPEWIEGPVTADKTRRAFGGGVDGWLTEELVVAEDALAVVPRELSYELAATLPCAGVTAWNALFETSPLGPDASVLLLGTGGVSVLALQLAHAAGLRTFITSSSETKLERARSLGADERIDYARQPEWEREVLERTGGRGVDRVLEIGGEGTLARSVAAARHGGSVVVIGGVTGFGGGVAPGVLLTQSKSLVGLYVGSRAHLERLLGVVARHRLPPVIDETFAFADARAAYAHLASGRHFGKVVIRLA